MTVDRVENHLGTRVPLCDLTRQARALKPELMSALERVVDSGRYVLGDEVRAFEQEIAGYVGARHAVGVASGTDALLLALKSVGIGPGDRVVTTPFTFFATASAILNCGAAPVFADVDPQTLNIDPEGVRRLLEGRSPVERRLGIDPDRIRAIVPVHLYGQPADADLLMAVGKEANLFVLEDAAQALGAECRGTKAGAAGHLGCFSFFPTKNLGGFGEGGMVVTSDSELAQRVSLLRVHGATRRYYHELIGTNSRIDALQAALLRVKLPHLDGWIAARRAHAAAYEASLAGIDGLELPTAGPDRTHIYHQYTVRVGEGARDDLRDFLDRRGIGTEVYYPTPLHLQPALAHLGYRRGDFESAEAASREVLSLPVFPELETYEVEHIVSSIRSFFGL